MITHTELPDLKPSRSVTGISVTCQKMSWKNSLSSVTSAVQAQGGKE
jgi:hypothetical protein